jgi:predicted neuraminidase
LTVGSSSRGGGKEGNASEDTWTPSRKGEAIWQKRQRLSRRSNTAQFQAVQSALEERIGIFDKSGRSDLKEHVIQVGVERQHRESKEDWVEEVKGQTEYAEVEVAQG